MPLSTTPLDNDQAALAKDGIFKRTRGNKVRIGPKHVSHQQPAKHEIEISPAIYNDILQTMPEPSFIPGGKPGHPAELRAEAVTLFLAGMSAAQIADAVRKRWRLDVSASHVRRWVANYRDQVGVRAESLEPVLYNRVQSILNSLLDMIERGELDVSVKDVTQLLSTTGNAVHRRIEAETSARRADALVRSLDEGGIPREAIDAEWESLESA